MKKKINLLITCAGSFHSQEIINYLNHKSILKFNLHLCDNEKILIKTKNFFISDNVKHKKFAKNLIEYCKKNKIDNILAFADEECYLLQRYITLKKLNINICSPDYRTIKIINDKYLLLSRLQKYSFVPSFYLCKTKKSLINSAKLLKYPEKKIILKPTNLRGSRGIIIINDKSKFSETFYRKNNFLEMNLREFDSIYKYLKNKKNNILSMNYFAGSDFNIDALYHNGTLINYVAQLRIKPKIGSITKGEIIYSSKIKNTLIQIGRELNISNIINVELIFDKHYKIKNAKPYLYEINPRPSANIMSTLNNNTTFIEDWLLIINGKINKKTKVAKSSFERYYERKTEKNN